MKNILGRPEVYHAYQIIGGFFSARLRALTDYVDFSGVRRIFDIGCGPGHITPHIPGHIDYIGFDTERRYVEFANRRFGGPSRRFVSKHFDQESVSEFGAPDLVLMNGVIHHMDDRTVEAVVRDAAIALGGVGSLFALDGCYVDNQHPISRYLLANDRGEFVRDADSYRALVAVGFPAVEVFVRNDLSWVPYTFAITKGGFTGS
jgi:SAM-dependent methyltransferase